MVEKLKHVVEALVLRAVPGLINLAALIILATWMNTATYGLMSTFIATSGALASLLFGHVTFSALAMHADHAGKGEQVRFEQHLVGSALAFALIVGATAFAMRAAGLPGWPLVLATATFGAYSAIQEILHARIEFVRFAIASTSQSLSFLALIYWLVRPDPTVEAALIAFALSYAIGALLSALLARVRPGRIAGDIVRASLKVGGPVTASTLAADSLALGCRYLLILFGGLQPLGVFSFSLDLAQKLIGIFINAATFAIVPRAFRGSAGVALADFRRALHRGAVLAVGIALASLAAMLAVGSLGLIAALDKPVYDPISFVLIALAVIANRTGKMVLSPVAMRMRRTGSVLAAFVIAAALALALAAAGIGLGVPYAAEASYLVAFTLWLALGWRFLARPAR